MCQNTPGQRKVCAHCNDIEKNENPMNESIEELQTRLAFQEDTIQELTHTIMDQQKEIYEIRVMLEHLHKQLKQVSTPEVNTLAEEPLPPHY